MVDAIKIEFCIAAGKYEDDDINWKYIDNATDCADALAKFQSVRDYPAVEFHIETHWSDGSRTRMPVFGIGYEEKLVDGVWQPVFGGG